MSNFNLFVLLIVFGVLVLACIGAGTFLLWHHLRTRGLREQFGPEYDRAVKRTGSRKAGEAELLERRRRHRTLELRTLDSTQLSEFQERWTDVQRQFVEDPTHAVRNADTLVVDVMSARGYPTNDLDQRADDLSVDHPHIAQHYRDARQVAKADKHGNASTEDLRQAVTAYRALLEELLTDRTGDVDLGGRGRGRRRGPGSGSDRDHGRDRDRLNDRDHGRDRDRDRRVEGREDRWTDERLGDRVDGHHRDSGRIDGSRDHDHDTRDDGRGGLRENPGAGRETRA